MWDMQNLRKERMVWALGAKVISKWKNDVECRTFIHYGVISDR